MLSVTYVSTAVALLSDDQLIELLATVRSLNIERRVTGMLLYRDGDIIQTIEGPCEAVRRTFAAIQADPRHRGLLVLLEEKLERRRFPDWSMGFRDVGGTMTSQPGYSNFLSPGAPALAGPEESMHRLMNVFRESLP